MGVITPLDEQLTKPLPNAIALLNLKELSSNAHKLLPEGSRLAVTVHGDEPFEELEALKSIDATMIFHNLPYTEEKISRVHTARRWSNCIQRADIWGYCCILSCWLVCHNSIAGCSVNST